MSKTLLELAYDKKKDWINIVKSFGCNPSSAEDIVQEMFIQLHHEIDEILNDMYWYDRKVFELCASGKSVASLSRETNISYYSLYNTYTNAKKHIKEKL